MPSKTSFFNKTTFRKDLTRFFPLWGLYLLCQLLGLMLIVDEREAYWIAGNFASLPPAMALINMVYALVAAAVLFGDLYNTRMCYGLHALPMSRGSWFVSHILSGLLFSLVPTAVMAAVALPVLAGTPVTNAWQLSLYWFAATNLQYFFFFSLAVLCALCAGNWLGLAAEYGLVNFGAYILCFLVDRFYTPLLPGVMTRTESFERFVPVVGLMERYIVMKPVSNWDNKGVEHLSGSFTLGEAWGYLMITVVLGLVLLTVAYLLYRRRKLESAGDFLAIRQLSPVLAVAMAVTGTVAFLGVLDNVGFGYSLENQTLLLFAFAGMVVFWFAGQMLLSRSTQVFHLRNWMGLGILTVVMAASLGLTKLDVLGISDWVPQPEDVQAVSYSFSVGDTLEDEAGIADMIRLHNLCLEEKLTGEQVQAKYRAFHEEHPDEEYPYNYLDVYFSYKLKNGSTVRRQYYLRSDAEGSEIVKHYSGTLHAILRNTFEDDVQTAEDLMAYVTKPERIVFDGFEVEEEYLTAENVKRLFQAVIADCEAGNLSQIGTFHPLKEVEREDGMTYTMGYYWLSVTLSERENFYLNAFLDSENIMAWAESVGITEEKLMEQYYG